MQTITKTSIKINYQDNFLLRARREAVPVTMFLMNGFQMRGVIRGFDAFVVVLESEGRQQIIYKHISVYFFNFSQFQWASSLCSLRCAAFNTVRLSTQRALQYSAPFSTALPEHFCIFQ